MIASSPAIQIEHLIKRFGQTRALDDVSLTIERGQFVTVLGPSGCGKTTLLRAIAGFVIPDSGSIMLDGVPVGDFPPHRRPTSLVFQNYALFPHLSVAENVAFGLREQRDIRLSRPEIADRVERALALVELEGFGGRRITDLSGGQQQRVALARSLVLEPTVLLLDEPLGALDVLLRRQMQGMLKHLQRQTGITFLAVTHDQEEALTLSDRIVVMNAGGIEQDGTPEDVFARPCSRFVAEFMGEGRRTLFPVAQDADGRWSGGGLTFAHPDGSALVDGQGWAMLPPTALQLLPPQDPAGSPDACRWETRVAEVIYRGTSRSVVVTLPDGTRAMADAGTTDHPLQPGDPLTAWLDPATLSLVPDRPPA